MFDPGSTSGGVEGFVKAHPMGIAVAVGAVILLIVLMGRGSSAPVAATGSTDDSATNAAASIQAAQVGANTQTALAGIQAGVTNNQTAAAQTIALATIQGTNDATAAASTATLGSAYYAAASHISDNNTASAITATQGQVAEQLAGDSVISGEFANLASVVSGFGNNTQSMVNNLNGGLGTGLNGVMPNLTNVDLSGLAAVGGSAGAYGAIAAVNTNNNNNVILTNLAISENATNAVSASNIVTTKANATSGALSSFTSWLGSLSGAFTQTLGAVAPVTPASNQNSLQSANAALLAGGPSQFISSSLAAF